MKKMKNNLSEVIETESAKQRKQWITPEMTEFNIQSGGVADTVEVTGFYNSNAS